MTKEELDKEADEFTDSKKSFWRQGRTCIDSVKQAYITGAEPREKRIEELEKKIKQLQDDIDCLTLACENYREEMEKNLANATELEKENAELKTIKIPQLERRIASIRGAHSVDCRKLNARTEQVERLKKENAELKDKNKALELYADLADSRVDEVKLTLYKAKGIILQLYNAGRDVLMYRAEEKAYDNLEEAINDRSIEQFL